MLCSRQTSRFIRFRCVADARKNRAVKRLTISRAALESMSLTEMNTYDASRFGSTVQQYVAMLHFLLCSTLTKTAVALFNLSCCRFSLLKPQQSNMGCSCGMSSTSKCWCENTCQAIIYGVHVRERFKLKIKNTFRSRGCLSRIDSR